MGVLTDYFFGKKRYYSDLELGKFESRVASWSGKKSINWYGKVTLPNHPEKVDIQLTGPRSRPAERQLETVKSFLAEIIALHEQVIVKAQERYPKKRKLWSDYFIKNLRLSTIANYQDIYSLPEWHFTFMTPDKSRSEPLTLITFNLVKGEIDELTVFT